MFYCSVANSGVSFSQATVYVCVLKKYHNIFVLFQTSVKGIRSIVSFSARKDNVI